MSYKQFELFRIKMIKKSFRCFLDKKRYCLPMFTNEKCRVCGEKWRKEELKIL